MTSMAKLIYTTIVSVDGFVADADGSFDWAAPDEEVHRFVTDLERRVGTYLYGRRMYEVMRFWETVSASDEQPLLVRVYATLWRHAAKVVYSRTLSSVSSAGTRIERTSSRRRCGGGRPQRAGTSAWEGPASPHRRSGPGWWTSATCSSSPAVRLGTTMSTSASALSDAAW